MVETLKNKSNQTIEQTLQQILDGGNLTREEHLQLVNIFLSDVLVTNEERYQINRVFDELQMGHLKFIN